MHQMLMARQFPDRPSSCLLVYLTFNKVVMKLKTLITFYGDVSTFQYRARSHEGAIIGF